MNKRLPQGFHEGAHILVAVNRGPVEGAGVPEVQVHCVEGTPHRHQAQHPRSRHEWLPKPAQPAHLTLSITNRSPCASNSHYFTPSNRLVLLPGQSRDSWSLLHLLALCTKALLELQKVPLPSSRQRQHPSKALLAHKDAILRCRHEDQVACGHWHGYEPCCADSRQRRRQVCPSQAICSDMARQQQACSLEGLSWSCHIPSGQENIRVALPSRNPSGCERHACAAGSMGSKDDLLWHGFCSPQQAHRR